jgi:hypothetical protein
VDRHHPVDRGGQSLDNPAGLFADLGNHLSRANLITKEAPLSNDAFLRRA